MPRKSDADYHDLAGERGFKWLGPPPPNVLTPTRWRCGRGHRWLARYHHIRQGTGCPVCAGTQRKTEADYLRLAARRRFTWLGPFPADASIPSRWRCAHGHIWRARYCSLASGSGCPHCAGQTPLTAARFRAIARTSGFKWLGPVVKAGTRTRWQCRQGHTWLALARTIAAGHGCPICAGKSRRTEADYHVLARAHGLTFLGPWPGTVMARTRWRCACGAFIDASFNAVSRRGRHRGCPLPPVTESPSASRAQRRSDGK